MNSVTMTVLAVVGVAVLAGGWWLTTYNRFIKLRNMVEASWKQIDVQLQRRYDLVPNLVATVKGYATHERETFEAVVRARQATLSARGAAERGEAEGDLSKTLDRLFALAENYPDLKASTNFLQLQNELTNTEDQISSARSIYNSNVREYNTRQQMMPARFVANQMALTAAEYFNMEEVARNAPHVTF